MDISFENEIKLPSISPPAGAEQDIAIALIIKSTDLSAIRIVDHRQDIESGPIEPREIPIPYIIILRLHIQIYAIIEAITDREKIIEIAIEINRHGFCHYTIGSAIKHYFA